MLGGDPVYATNESSNADYYQWSFGNGSFSNDEEPELTYTEPGTYNVFLTATDADSQCSDQATGSIVVEAEDAVDDLSLRMAVFPNPTSEEIRFVLYARSLVEVRDATGRMAWAGTLVEGAQRMDVTTWPPGVYTLTVSQDVAQGATHVARFTVQR